MIEAILAVVGGIAIAFVAAIFIWYKKTDGIIVVVDENLESWSPAHRKAGRRANEEGSKAPAPLVGVARTLENKQG
jgi:hypothetical protein